MSHTTRTASVGCSRRIFCGGLAAAAAWPHGALAAQPASPAGPVQRDRAQIAITLDLEMSRDYPRRGMEEWNFQKGNLDEATKDYSAAAGRVVRQRGGRIHFFCVGRVLEQPDIGWLEELHAAGHAIGNHTYDHVNVAARTIPETQFRFQRAPWLAAGRTPAELIRENIRLTSVALRERAKIEPNGFRTPGGFHNGLADRLDVRQMLSALGYRWISSKYPPHLRGETGQAPSEEVYQSIVDAQAAAQPFLYPDGLLEIPMSPISDVTAFRATRWRREWFLEALRRSVQWAIDHRGVYDFLAHPSCLVVEDPEFESLKLICQMVRDAGDKAEFATLDQIAAPYLS